MINAHHPSIRSKEQEGSLRDDDVESNRAFVPASVVLGELQRRVVAANASSNASKSLALFVVAWATTETVGIAEKDLRRVGEGSSQHWLVVVGSLAGDRERNTRVALEDDVAGALLVLL